ncbi:ParM/StbA family protein [Acidiferrobacter sp.]|uniref:ParM/StbA family protein n=1 Tax=Acidiferrobacter sp. TaxID=1872107 RepID=UPI0026390011|nr:ParM/StbA family protein [Acidiferrobacter sp.]
MIPVGIDDGYAQTKACFRLLDTDDHRTMVLPSQGRSGPHALGGTEGDTPDCVYLSNDERITIDAHLVDPDDTRGDGYKLSALNRAMVMEALHQAGMDSHPALMQGVCLVTGLPYNRYFTAGGEPNRDLISAKMAQFRRYPVTRANGKPVAHLAAHAVSPEAVAALAAFEVENPGGIGNGWAAVIDIGGQTTDIVLISRNPQGARIDHAHSTTDQTAMLSVHDYMRRHAQSQMLGRPLSRRLCDTAVRQFVRNGRAVVRVDRAERDLSDMVADSLRAVGQSLGRTVDRALAAASADIDLILVTGGGAQALAGSLGIQGADIITDPETANARGFYYKAREMARQAAGA